MEERKIRVIFSKIGSKLIVPYLIISFLTLAIIAGLVYYNYNVQVDSIQKIQDEISIKASSEINFYIERIVSELELFSNEIGKTNRFDKTLNLKSLKNLIEHDPSIYSLSIADINGIEINKIVKYYDMETASELKDTHTEEKFKKAIEGDIFLGPIYISKYDIPFISISSPISDDDGEIIGVLASEVDLSPMWGTISKIKVKKTGYVYVVDNDGHLIAYKDIALVKEHLDLNHIGGVRNFFNNVHVSDGYISFNDEEVIGDWKMIEIVGWGLIVELPSKEVFQELSPLLNIGGISVIAFVLFIIIIPMIILRVVLKPLGYLQEGVMEVRSGNLGYKISKTSKDEIGEITSAFNQMTVDLKKSQESIKKHAEEMEGKVEERTSELNEKLGELSDTKTAVLNMMEDMDEANIKLIKTQEELEKSLAELKETDIKKDQFISIAAHELKTPLTSIHGFSQLLMNKKVANNFTKRNKYLKIMDHETKRLGKLVGDILDLSRIDLGTVKMSLVTLDVNEFIENMEREMEMQIKDKGLTSKYAIEKKLPKIQTDKEKLTEVIINLINNAIKYSQKGKITVKGFKENENIHFIVKDNGIGVSKGNLEKIFDRFYQIDSSYTRSVGGTGLGLSLCKEFVVMLGGKIWVNSVLGKGSEFHFTLPISGVSEKSKTERKKKAEETIKRAKELQKNIKEAGGSSP